MLRQVALLQLEPVQLVQLGLMECSNLALLLQQLQELLLLLRSIMEVFIKFFILNLFNIFLGSSLPSTSFGTTTTNSFNQPSTSSSVPLVASLSTHPFQYLQQCYDPTHSNYRFRVIYLLILMVLNDF